MKLIPTNDTAKCSAGCTPTVSHCLDCGDLGEVLNKLVAIGTLAGLQNSELNRLHVENMLETYEKATSTCLPKAVCNNTINAFEQISRQLSSQLGGISSQLGTQIGGIASQVGSQLESIASQHGSQLGSIANLVDIKSLLPKVKCACIRGGMSLGRGRPSQLRSFDSQDLEELAHKAIQSTNSQTMPSLPAEMSDAVSGITGQIDPVMIECFKSMSLEATSDLVRELQPERMADIMKNGDLETRRRMVEEAVMGILANPDLAEKMNEAGKRCGQLAGENDGNRVYPLSLVSFALVATVVAFV